MSIIYRVATIADRCEIRKLLTVHFYTNEPFNVGWIGNDGVPEEDVELTLEASNMSIVAIDESTNSIVGACLAGIDTPNAVEWMLNEAATTTNNKWAQYLRLYARIDKESDIFERYNVQEIFHVHALVVDANYRNCSIGTQLMEKCYDFGASKDYKVCSVNCSSIYTEKIAIKLQMECVSAIAMDSVMDENEERLIYPTQPHTHIRTYAKRLCNDD